MPIVQSKIHRAMGLLEQVKFHLLECPTEFYIDAYQNGAEQGFTIYNTYKAVTFSETVKSDSIVVYLNSFADRGIDEHSYYTAKTFTTEFDAIKYIITHLTE
jgi:hypothetical protein